MIRFFLLSFFLLYFSGVYAVKQDTLYINRGIFTAVDNTQFPYLAYNTSPIFSQHNAALILEVNDTLILSVVNNDTSAHGFSMKSPMIQSMLNPGDTLTDTLVYTQVSIHAFYDHLQFPNAKNAGLCGSISVVNSVSDHFYIWNLKDHQAGIQNLITGGGTYNWSQYLPGYFTINEKSFNDVQSDSLTRINNSVGDTIYIFVLNAGQSMHSLHFHGFHPETVFADARKIQAGWEKDTWGMFSMDAMVLQMIPDKSGQYSVHDHNLVAISAGGTHPNGMFTIMQINP